MVTYNGMTVDKKALPGDYDAFEQVLSSAGQSQHGSRSRDLNTPL